MVVHPPGRVEHGAVAAEHDGDVGRQLRQVGIGREVDAGQDDPGRTDHGHGQPLGLGVDLFPRPVAQEHQPERRPGHGRVGAEREGSMRLMALSRGWRSGRNG